MSRGCGYCGQAGHSVDVCPERLEEYHGLPSDHVDDSDDEEVETDGGSTTMSTSDTSDQSNLEQPDEPQRPSWSPTESDGDYDGGARVTCENCGHSVSKHYARVFGDNDGVVHNCLHCQTHRDVAKGGGADSDGGGWA